MSEVHKPHLMPCGHPESAVVSSGEGTSYCGECAERSQHSVRPTGREVAMEKQVLDLESQVHGLSSLVADKLMQIDSLEEQLEQGQSSVSTEEDTVTDSPIERYDQREDDMEHSPRGEWVRWADVASIFEQSSALQRERDHLLSAVGASMDDTKYLGMQEQLEAASEAQDQATRNHAHLVSVLEGQRDELKEQLEASQRVRAELQEMVEVAYAGLWEIIEEFREGKPRGYDGPDTYEEDDPVVVIARRIHSQLSGGSNPATEPHTHDWSLPKHAGAWRCMTCGVETDTLVVSNQESDPASRQP